MKKERINLWNQNEYVQPSTFGFLPNLMTYLHEENTASRPCIIVAPGGGYRVVSPTEGEIVALTFYEMGYNTFVLTYTTNHCDTAPVRLQALNDISRAVRLVRRNSTVFHIDPNRVIVCGFSAAGHLCASLCVHYADIPDRNSEYQAISNRPDAAILSYPVITSGEKAHRDSFVGLLGKNPSEEDLNYMSLEKHVTKQTPPCFLWQTATDELVPVENSYLFARACKNAGIPFAHHVFSSGLHGLSLANEIWASGEYGDPYTLEQSFLLCDAIREGKIDLPDDVKTGLFEFEKRERFRTVPDPRPLPPKSISVWPKLADAWLSEVFG